jgi:hypothetical protein
LETFASAAMASVLAAAKPSRRNTRLAPDRIWSRFALALGPSSSDAVTNEISYLSKLNSTVLLCALFRELSRVICGWFGDLDEEQGEDGGNEGTEEVRELVTGAG